MDKCKCTRWTSNRTQFSLYQLHDGNGVATAGMIRVSHYIGKEDYVGMKEVGRVAFGMVAAFMFVCALLFFAFRFYLPTLYIDDPEVISLAASLLILAGFFKFQMASR